ncbi:hypothetical protein BGZ76_002836 [Entomortierella beljakovae]|nr:hypothetical protein BGZ76_002836 [Entomortierella beljakovae]
MELYSQKYIKLGYIPIGISLHWDEEKQQKDVRFKKNWQTATLETSSRYFYRSDNGIALVTGDANGTSYTIDTRGDKGCIIVAPSAITKGGVAASYKWIKPLVARESLPSMPQWCIKYLNANSQIDTGLEASMQRSLVLSPRIPKLLQEQDEGKTPLMAQVDFRAEEILGVKLRRPLRQCDDGFDFQSETKVACTLCGATHTKNNYKVRPILRPCFYMRNYSKNCITRAYGWEDHPILKQVLEYPATDIPYCHILDAVFNDRGFKLVYAYKHHSATTGRFLYFNGDVWQEIHASVIRQEIEAICGKILDSLIKYIRPVLGCKDKEEIKKIQKLKAQLKHGRAYISRSSNTKRIVEMYATLHADHDIEGKLDLNPDLLVACNGVIDLKTGMLRNGLPEDNMSKRLDIDYKGIDSSTKDINALMKEIFNDDMELINFLQKFLGYGITGHTKEHCWAIFTGSGSNGKSLLIGLIENLMKPWYKVAPYEIFFQSRKAQPGGATPHLHQLKGARICVKEETEPKDQLNIELIKIITGESSITSRPLYSNDYESFSPTALPILLCNHKPDINVYDDAMMRRVLVFPFTNIYTSPEDMNRPYDIKNPRHRRKDPNKREKLLSKSSQEQLLVWLVQGAVKWYTEGLGELPQCMKDAYNEYRTENDKLLEFIEYCCEVNPEHKVNAKAFRDTFCDYIGGAIQQKDLIEMMRKRGFLHGNCRVGNSVTKMYQGLRLISPDMPSSD